MDHDDLRYFPLSWKEALSEYCVTELDDKSYIFFWYLLQNMIGYQFIGLALSWDSIL